MEHIGLPLLPCLPYILNSLVEEPLPKTSPECMYIISAELGKICTLLGTSENKTISFFYLFSLLNKSQYGYHTVQYKVENIFGFCRIINT